jgi:16S rRNA processing protein RimM
VLKAEIDHDALVLVGRVTSIFGVKGWVNVYSYTDPVENILNYKGWLLSPVESDGQKNRQSLPDIKSCKRVEVSNGQRHGKRIIAQLENCESRELAGSFVQQDIFVERAQLPELEDDVYWVDLEGLQVINLQGQVLGQIVKLFETGANDVMVVQSNEPDVPEILIPYVEDHYIIDVDFDQGQVKVDWLVEND